MPCNTTATASRVYMTALETHDATILNDNTCSQASNSTNTACCAADSDTIPHLRPGQLHKQKTINIDIHSAHGASFLVRDKNDIRIFFQSVKGLACSCTREDYDCVQQSNPRLDLPLRDFDLTLEQVTIHLDEAATHLQHFPKNSTELQFRNCNNLLAEYNTDTNQVKKLSEQEAAAVCSIICTKHCRAL